MTGTFRTEVLAGLIADSSGEAQISTAIGILAEIIGQRRGAMGHIRSSY